MGSFAAASLPSARPKWQVQGNCQLQTRTRDDPYETPWSTDERRRRAGNERRGPRGRQGGFGSRNQRVRLLSRVCRVGVASTIDNDLYGTELWIGVDTALN